MSDLNWLFGKFSTAFLNSLIDTSAIGALKNTGPDTFTGDLTVTGLLKGVTQGVNKCDTASNVDAKVITGTTGLSENQTTILVYFANAQDSAPSSAITVQMSDWSTPHTLYIGGVVSSPTNYAISQGMHLITFETTVVSGLTQYKAYLDYLIPNAPLSYLTTLSWEPEIDSQTQEQTGLKLQAQSYGANTVLSPNIPVASASAYGIMSTGAQTFSGDKTFTGNISALSVTATSSRQAKTNINPFVANAIDVLKTVNVVSFNYKNDLEHLKVGFIAEDTDPLLSSENQNKFDIGNSIGLLIKGVQELNQRLEKLENGIKN